MNTSASNSLSRQSGITLIELIISIVIITIAVAGILSVFNHNVARSADPLMQHQALAIAESYLDEILSKLYAHDQDICPSDSDAHRSTFCTVDEYDGLNQPPHNQNGQSIAPLSGYYVSVNVSNASLGGVPAKRVEVTVTHPAGVNLRLEGYRTDY